MLFEIEYLFNGFSKNILMSSIKDQLMVEIANFEDLKLAW
jgi:hypothetical protein